MSRDRGHILRRFIRLTSLLTTGERTLDELTGELHCDRRTLYRDLAAMRELGIAIRCDVDRTGYRYHLQPEALIDVIVPPE